MATTEAWLPVDDGIICEDTWAGDYETIGFGPYNEYEFWRLSDNRTTLEYGSDPEHDYISIPLPDGLKICRQVAPETDAIPLAEIRILCFSLEAWHIYGEGIASETELRDLRIVRKWLEEQEARDGQA